MLVAATVTVVWGIATVASVITHDVAAVGIVTPVMLIVAGGLMAVRKNGKNGNAA